MRIQRRHLGDLILATFRSNEESERFLTDQGDWGDKIARAVPSTRVSVGEYAWETADRLVRWAYAQDYLMSFVTTAHLPEEHREMAAKLLGIDNPARELVRRYVPDPVPDPTLSKTAPPVRGKRRMTRRIAKKIIARIARGDYPAVWGYECAPGHHPWLRRHEAQRARQRAQLATVPRRLGVEYFARMGRSAAWWDHFVQTWTAPMSEPPYPTWRGGYYVGARPCP